jgi:hypothetical protein
MSISPIGMVDYDLTLILILVLVVPMALHVPILV